ncbi:hypothetical protein RchiOBHm_Chr5g0065681 [Rosa chinensis]|uniref:Uncharacterized protein n=1 Tax=Rosa chinensis TaxID=74649 RepID=A0A2P6QJ19_ROSCH|nr:hypothetical protein RchiOBHm_Chr5g0065681 [Rosa chinensis]
MRNDESLSRSMISLLPFEEKGFGTERVVFSTGKDSRTFCKEIQPEPSSQFLAAVELLLLWLMKSSDISTFC